MPTVYDVARRSNVSVATVSRVMNGTGYVSPPLVEAVRTAAGELGYGPRGRRHSAAERLTVGMVIPDIGNDFYSALIMHLRDVIGLAHPRLTLLIVESRDNRREEHDLFRALKKQHVDAFVVVPVHTPLALYAHQSRPCVVVDKDSAHNAAPAVVCDNYRGACLATDYLVQKGHRRIALITGPTGVSTAEERLSGYLETLNNHGISVVPELVLRGPFTADHGFSATKRLLALSSPPTAIFAANNEICRGVLSCCRDHDVSVPDRVSIVSFDDTDALRLYPTPITAIRQPLREMARHIHLLLRESLAGHAVDRRTVLVPDLVERASVKTLKI